MAGKPGRIDEVLELVATKSNFELAAEFMVKCI